MTGCPAWCVGDHGGGRRHLAEIEAIHLDGMNGEKPLVLFADLRQGPDDEQPTVHVARDRMPILQLSPGDAIDLG